MTRLEYQRSESENPQHRLQLNVFWIAVFLSVSAGCRNQDRVKKAEPRRDVETIRALNTNRPLAFVEDYFQKEFLENPLELTLKVEAIEEDFVLKLEMEQRNLEVLCESVFLSRGDGLFTISFHSSPMTDKDATDFAIRICDFLGLESEKIRTWRKNIKGSINVMTPSCLVRKTIAGRDHSVELRYSFDHSSPIFVIYQLSFNTYGKC